MVFVSYAQNLEDVMLWRALKSVQSGFYIDVGAYSPTEDSVTRAFYDRGWRGINIEPQPQFHRQLAEYRPRDVNLQIALGAAPGSGKLRAFGTSGLATLREEVANDHVAAGWQPDGIDVRIDTLSNLVATYGPANHEVHFLKIDVEGSEDEVLKGADFESFRPWIVVVEATRPLSAEQNSVSWEGILLNNRYSFAYFDGLNRFYVADEASHLMKHFGVPPNVFDEFVLARTAQCEAELQRIQRNLPWRLSRPVRWALRQVRSRRS